MHIDHIGIVVREFEPAIEFWKGLGYRQHTRIVVNTKQKVRVVFLKKDGSLDVKLIAPSDPDSPISQLSKRGGGLHHLCFKCEEMDRQIGDLQAHGARLLVAPQSGEAFNHAPIAFLMGSDNVNLELIDTDERAEILDVEARDSLPA